MSLVGIEGPWTLAQIEAALQIEALSPAEQRATLAAAQQKQAAEDSLRAFVEQAWDVLEPGTKFIPGVHVDAVCLHLQAMIEGRIKDLLINIPPGFAKSMICAVFMPAWVWINDPGYRFLFSSYKAEYAIRDSVKCRTLIQSNWYQDRWKDRFQLKADQNEKSKFENDHTGYREITSVGTGTGSRAMLVCVDDPMSVDQAASDAERDRANAWWTGTMTTRLNDLRTGHLLLIQQRLHEEDTTAVCLEQGGYVHLYLPNEFEVDRACKTAIWQDPRTKEGELLWPAKVGPDEVAMLKRKLGSYSYAGQYQQRPSPAGGGIFKKWWWRYWKYKTLDCAPVIVRLPDGTMQRIHAVNLPDDLDQVIQSWDMAFKDLSTSDYVAGGVWGTKKGRPLSVGSGKGQAGLSRDGGGGQSPDEKVAQGEPEAGGGQGQRAGGDPGAAPRDPGPGGSGPGWRQSGASAGGERAGGKRQHLFAAPLDRALGGRLRGGVLDFP